MTRRGEALSRLVSEEKLIRGVRRDAVCLVDSINWIVRLDSCDCL